jgi:hypothetical protein
MTEGAPGAGGVGGAANTPGKLLLSRTKVQLETRAQPVRAELVEPPVPVRCNGGVPGRFALLMAIGSGTVALSLVPSGAAKPRDGIPAWVGASSAQTLARVFGSPTVVGSWNIPYPRTIVVVWEFQWITVCRTCSAPSNAVRPRGRVVRVSFDRRTHRLTGAMRFCEVHGATPPLSRCLAR